MGIGRQGFHLNTKFVLEKDKRDSRCNPGLIQKTKKGTRTRRLQPFHIIAQTGELLHFGVVSLVNTVFFDMVIESHYNYLLYAPVLSGFIVAISDVMLHYGARYIPPQWVAPIQSQIHAYPPAKYLSIIGPTKTSKVYAKRSMVVKT